MHDKNKCGKQVATPFQAGNEGGRDNLEVNQTAGGSKPIILMKGPIPHQEVGRERGGSRTSCVMNKNSLESLICVSSFEFGLYGASQPPFYG